MIGIIITKEQWEFLKTEKLKYDFGVNDFEAIPLDDGDFAISEEVYKSDIFALIRTAWKRKDYSKDWN